MKTKNLIWHIFKKDCGLLWPFILGAAGLQFITMALRYALDHVAWQNVQALLNLYNLLLIATIAAPPLLIATAVHQDAVPGVRQDWLVRPVKRRDLLLAKLLFLLLMVQGPILLADMMQAMANGFPLIPSLGAAASRNLYLLLGLSLPVFAFASLTRNMAETVIGAVAGLLGFGVLQILINNRGQVGPLRGTGLFWIAESSMFAIALLGSIVVLAMQYFRRKTMLARGAMAGVAFLFLLAYMVPWNFAFALEQRLSPSPGAGSSIVMTFNPSMIRFRLPDGMSRSAVAATLPGRATRDEASTVYLPLQIAGLPADGALNTDNSELVLRDADNTVIYRGPADDLVVRKDGPAEPAHFTVGIRRSAFFRDIGPEDTPVPESNGGQALVYQGVALPRSLYDRIKNRPLRLEINYSLTLLRATSYNIPALNADLRIPNVGHCRSRMDDEADDIVVNCIQAGAASTDCNSAFLEHAPSGRRNPARFYCWPNYSPYFGQYLPDAMTRNRASFPFRDLSGLAKYPVDASQLPDARVVLRVYEAQDHFTRQLVIPRIQLSDWESLEHTQVAENR